MQNFLKKIETHQSGINFYGCLSREESNSNYQIDALFVIWKGKAAFPPPKAELTNLKLETIQKVHTCNSFDSFVPKDASKFIKLLFVFKIIIIKKWDFFYRGGINTEQRCT